MVLALLRQQLHVRAVVPSISMLPLVVAFLQDGTQPRLRIQLLWAALLMRSKKR